MDLTIWLFLSLSLPISLLSFSAYYFHLFSYLCLLSPYFPLFKLLSFSFTLTPTECFFVPICLFLLLKSIIILCCVSFSICRSVLWVWIWIHLTIMTTSASRWVVCFCFSQEHFLNWAAMENTVNNIKNTVIATTWVLTLFPSFQSHTFINYLIYSLGLSEIRIQVESVYCQLSIGMSIGIYWVII